MSVASSLPGAVDRSAPAFVALVGAVQAAGLSPATGDLFCALRAAGADWELLTAAVAEGLATRATPSASTLGAAPSGAAPTAAPATATPPAGSAAPPPPRATTAADAHATPAAGSADRLGTLRAVALAVGVYLLLRPLLGLGHELAVTACAFVAHALVATGWWQPLIQALGLDPVYTGAAIRAIGGVDVLGLAFSNPLGGWLHAWLPAVFQPPERVAPGAAISMVAAPGAPALGRGLAAFGADVVWLVIGLWLFWHWRRRAWPAALVGLLIQAQVAVHHLFEATLSLSNLDASGLPYAIAMALPGPSQDVWFTTALQRLPGAIQNTVIGGSRLVLGYAAALLVLVVTHACARVLARVLVRVRARVWHRRPSPRATVTARAAAPRLLSRAAMSATLAVLVAVSPVGAFARGRSNWQSSEVPRLTSRSLVPGAAGRLRALLQNPAAAGPSVVRVTPTADGGWQYVVDGQPTVIRGVGYNPQYASLAAGDRAQLYQRDFGAMHALGINTIEGWDEKQFDSLTLDYAARNGIGVLMPFEINQDWDLTNANVRQSIIDHVSAMVERYKDHPAVRMWAPGNENLHRILYAHWTSHDNDPTARARADAFAAFLPVLADRIHQLDPNHPVLYRDAEDVYLPRLKAALEADGVQRPWLVYGANVYSPSRLQEIINQWPAQWLPGPLVISEYAPGGAGPADRPLGFQQDWAIIRSRPGIVLGGLAYTWATNGPEELDRVFGLVDPNGIPTDNALPALSAAYLNDP